jgi:SHS2 domain-containing protein
LDLLGDRARHINNKTMSPPPWEEIEHTADWALRVRGRDLAALFENAARGMLSLMGGEIEAGETYRRTITLQAPDRIVLLVDWLNELLYVMESDEVLLDTIDIRRLTDTTLEAEVRGGRSRNARQQIKAASYHNLAIQDVPAGYETVIVFDV